MMLPRGDELSHSRVFNRRVTKKLQPNMLGASMDDTCIQLNRVIVVEKRYGTAIAGNDCLVEVELHSLQTDVYTVGCQRLLSIGELSG